MRISEPTEWVVYRTVNRNQVEGQCAICSQDEWSAMHAATPDGQVLIQEHINSETAAERLARSLIIPAVTTKSPRKTPSAVRTAPRIPIAIPNAIPNVAPETAPG